jgi:glycosyltransferase involved in cell wall biosynthesis
MTEMQPMPRDSLVIMSCNQEAYIDDAIVGATGQDYANLEIIITDDGSSDRTPQVIAGWASRHPDKTIPVLSAVNSGISKNCNRGLAQCSGEFVSFVDDDVLLPSRISEWLAQFEARPDAVRLGHRGLGSGFRRRRGHVAMAGNERQSGAANIDAPRRHGATLKMPSAPCPRIRS